MIGPVKQGVPPGRRRRRPSPSSLGGVLVLWGIALACVLVTACAGAQDTASDAQGTALLPEGSCSLSLPAGASPEETIWALIESESQFVVSQKIDQLMALWAEDGQIVDERNTPGRSDDDQLWRGPDAIRYRYTRYVFPSAPMVARPSDPVITMADDVAIVVATTRIGHEVSPSGDRWELVKKGDCWFIRSLAFNREAVP